MTTVPESQTLGLGRPTWIPSTTGFLEAWVHLPQDGRPDRVVVLAPSSGREQATSHRAMRQLAIDLAASGAMAVRFSWTGTGSSSDLDSEDPAGVWIEDLRAVLRWCHGQVDLPTQVLGLRLGAVIAANAVGALGDVRLLLWDPAFSGRTFLRQQRGLLMAIVPGAIDVAEGGSAGPGTYHTQAQARSIGDLGLPGILARPDRILVLTREAPIETRVLRRLSDAGATVEPVAGQEAMVDALSEESIVPTETLARIVRWSVTQERGRPAPVAGHFTQVADNPRFRETFVQVGPSGLPGLLTEPLTAPTGAVLLVGGSSEPMDGPSGLWSYTARRLAEQGFTVLRFDRHGVGDAAYPGDITQPSPYQPLAVADLGDALRWLRERTHLLPHGVGLCAGGTLLLQPNLRDLLASVCAVNVGLWSVRPSTRTLTMPEAWGQAAAPTRTTGLKRRVGRRAQRSLPFPVWRRLARTLSLNSPADLILGGDSITRMTLVMSDHDHAVFRAKRGPDALRVARSRGRRIAVQQPPGIDHALFLPGCREALLTSIITHLEEPG
jgi:alpha-beta hydrolase superfamily lysophospholipase